MGAGRPPAGWKHIDNLNGAQEDKQRLRVILETVAGTTSVGEACSRLGVSEARFHVLRRQALEGALGGLAPGRPGRPVREDPAEPGRVAELERQVEDLVMDLEASRIQTEIALVMPEVLKRGRARPAKKNADKANRRRRRRRGEGKS
jgi:transposase